jgi:hypothetical protein
MSESFGFEDAALVPGVGASGFPRWAEPGAGRSNEARGIADVGVRVRMEINGWLTRQSKTSPR